MKKYLLSFLASLLVGATLFGQTVSTVPAPIIAAGTAKIVLKQSTGTEYYIYTWAVAGATNYPACAWADTQAPAFKFVSEGAGVFSFSIASLKSFYKLTDAQLLTITKIGLLVKDSGGNKLTPNDLFYDVTQAPVQQYGGGDGTIAVPYLITNTADLSKLSTTSSDWGKAFKVTAAIVATNVTATIGNTATPFTGTFDGGNFDISGSTLTGSNDVGFFGVVDGATITKISLKSVSIKATGNNVGGLIGSAKGACNISNSAIQGTVATDGGAVGGFIGQLSAGNLSSNFANATVTSKYGSAAGGFVGLASGATSNIADCYATGTVTGVSSTAVGGFVGKLDASAKIATCYATSNVGSGNEFVGGFVGANYSTIQNSFATTATIAATGKYVAQFGGNNNSENISTGNQIWGGAKLSAGSFTGSGDAATSKSPANFNDQASLTTLGFSFSASKWRWDAGSYPALNTIAGQTYPYPFQVGTPLFSVEAKANISVYPTLVTENLTLVGEDVVRVAIINLSGITVLEVNDMDRTQSENRISLGALNAGIYIVKATTASGSSAALKVIKK